MLKGGKTIWLYKHTIYNHIVFILININLEM